jgi:hypothetical protein
MIIALKFRLGTFVRLNVCSNHHGKIRHLSFHTLHHDNKLANTETVSYIVWLGKINDVQKSRFQVTKMKKMNRMKHPTEKEGLDVSFKIWFRDYCMYVLITTGELYIASSTLRVYRPSS